MESIVQHFIILWSLILFAPAVEALETADPVGEVDVELSVKDSRQRFTEAFQDLSAMFAGYQPRMVRGVKRTTPVTVTEEAEPLISFDVKKCLLFVCQRAEFRARVSGFAYEDEGCLQARQVELDLSSSSSNLSEYYSVLELKFCQLSADGGRTRVRVRGQVYRTKGYRENVTQRLIMDLLEAQTQPLVDTFEAAMIAE